MQVGSFGDIVFQCSANELHTFKDLTRSRSAQFAEHAVLEQKSRLQFLGLGLEEVKFTVQLHAAFTDPAARTEAFRVVQAEGEPRNLVLGGQNLGQFVIVEIRESRKHLGMKGVVLFAELELTLREYN